MAVNSTEKGNPQTLGNTAEIFWNLWFFRKS